MRNRKIGFVFQSFNLIPRTRALRNVELPLVYAGVKRRRAPRARAAPRCERSGSRTASTTSRPSSRAASSSASRSRGRSSPNPAIILADEPTGNLDRESTARDARRLRPAATRRGRTIVADHARARRRRARASASSGSATARIVADDRSAGRHAAPLTAGRRARVNLASVRIALRGIRRTGCVGADDARHPDRRRRGDRARRGRQRLRRQPCRSRSRARHEHADDLRRAAASAAGGGGARGSRTGTQSRCREPHRRKDVERARRTRRRPRTSPRSSPVVNAQCHRDLQRRHATSRASSSARRPPTSRRPRLHGRDGRVLHRRRRDEPHTASSCSARPSSTNLFGTARTRSARRSSSTASTSASIGVLEAEGQRTASQDQDDVVIAPLTRCRTRSPAAATGLRQITSRRESSSAVDAAQTRSRRSSPTHHITDRDRGRLPGAQPGDAAVDASSHEPARSPCCSAPSPRSRCSSAASA